MTQISYRIIWDFKFVSEGMMSSNKKCPNKRRLNLLHTALNKIKIKSLAQEFWKNKADNPAIGAEQRMMDVCSILDYQILIRVWN